MDTLSLQLDGYTDLPKGKIAAIVTNLEMRAPPHWLLTHPMPAGFTMKRVVQPDAAWYRRLYRAVGADWLWFSRLKMPAAQLQTMLDESGTEIYAAQHEGKDIGLVELDFRKPPSCEIVYFGLVGEAMGKGFGRAMMAEALRQSWRAGIERVWIHTCTLDSPSGLALYRKAGFEPYLMQIEVMDDPRLVGLLPLECGAHVPVMS